MATRLLTLPITTPAIKGLNKQQSSQILDLGWATELRNAVIDSQNKPASRNGTKRVNVTSVTNKIEQIFEYIDRAGNTLTICSESSYIRKVDGTSLTDISGTITTPTAANWKFINFNGKCVGFQANHSPIVLSSISGTFTNITLSGTQQPTTAANDAIPFLGRIFVLDGSDLKYSDLLDETAYNSVYDLSQYWGSGGDIGVALAEFNGNLIVFGKNNILIFDGSSGNPDNLTKIEAIQGVGCVARDSVQQVGDDIWFLSNSGVQSLGRTIQEKSMPRIDISRNIRDSLSSLVNAFSVPIKSTYNEKAGFYLLSIPGADKAFYFDTRIFLPDGSARVAEWDGTWYSLATDSSQTLYLGTIGYVNTYTGYKDNVNSDGTGGNSYEYHLHTPWTPIHDEIRDKVKILKRASIVAFTGTNQTISFHWSINFEARQNVVQTVLAGGINRAQYTIAQYTIGTYSSSVDLDKASVNISKVGQYFSFGVHGIIDGVKLAIQSINVQAKLGREVR